MVFQRISASLYHALVMTRHPEAIRLKARGINYEHYRALRRPWLLALNIGTILDVGANVGQFAALARAVFPAARIYSFEPLPECFAILQTRLPRHDFQAFNLALGDTEVELDFYRAQHSPSSSFLRMTEAHLEAFPESRNGQEHHSIKVPVRKLDDVANALSLEGNILLKMDVQGYEKNVIRGAAETLRRVSVIIVEMSFITLYEGQPLFRDVHDALVEAGFEFQGNLNQAFHPTDGRIVSGDSIFVRSHA